MGMLEDKVRSARRRLNVRRFASALVWCWFAALTVVLAWVLADGLWGLPVGFDVALPVGLGAGLVGALVVGWRRRARPLAGAAALDRAFGLHERVSTSISLCERDRQTPAGRAVVADADQAVRRADVRRAVPVDLPRHSWLPIIPAVLLAIVVGLGERLSLAGRPTPIEDEPAPELVQQEARLLKKRLAQLRRLAKDQDLKEAEAQIARIEDQVNQMLAEPKTRRRDALMKISKVAEAVRQRREQLGDPDQLKQRLKDLRSAAKDGPAERFAKAMAQGDFKKAMQELQRIRQALAEGKMPGKERQRLAKQMDQLAKQLKQLADKQAMAKQLKQMNLPPDQLNKALAQLDKLGPQLKQLNKLAQALNQCRNCMKQGDGAQAAQALQQGAQQLEDLLRQIEEQNLLAQALDGCKGCKQGMCNGQGQGQGMGMDFDRPGDGLGRGRGRGPRPEQKNPTAAYDSKVKSKLDKGRIDLQGFVRGHSLKNETKLEFREAARNAQQDASDAVSRQRIPRAYKENIRRYFQQLRDDADQ